MKAHESQTLCFNLHICYLQALYDHSLPVLLELGCDSNTVVRQIFSELTYQMIHWETSRAQESTILPHIMVRFRDGLLL